MSDRAEARGILRGALPLGALEGLTLLLSLVTLPYLTRVLGPEDFGRYAFGVSAAGLLAMLVDFGFPQLGPKAVARAPALPAARAALLWEVQGAKLLLAVLCLPLLAAAAWLAGLQHSYGEVLPPVVLGAAASLLLPQWFLQGLQRFRTLAWSLALARLLAALATFAFVRTSADAALAVWLQVGAGALAGVLALRDAQYRQAARFVLPAWSACRRWLREAAPLFASNAAIAGYTTCVPLVLGLLTTPTVVGLFSAADKARIAGQTLLSPIGVAGLPRFSRLIHEDRAQGMRVLWQVARLQTVVALTATVAIVLLAEPALRLIAGADFVAAAPAARILACGLVFTAFTQILGVHLMLPLNMDRAFSAVLAASALTGLVATALLSPRWLEVGAAAAVLGTEVMIVGLMAWVLRRRGVI